MGTYYSTFIGCYIKVPNNMVTVKDTYYKKPNGKRATTKFNPETGEPYEKVTATKEERQYADIYMEDDVLPEGLKSGMFSSPSYAGEGYDYTVGLEPGGFNQEYDFNHSMNDIDINMRLLAFKLKYDKYIKYFEKKYGECQVHYGVVHHGS